MTVADARARVVVASLLGGRTISTKDEEASELGVRPFALARMDGRQGGVVDTCCDYGVGFVRVRGEVGENDVVVCLGRRDGVRHGEGAIKQSGVV
jgi:hypothetical protein